jgi:hypothetical protein
VHEPRLINLLIIGHDGIAYPSTEIVLQDGDPIPTTEQAPRGYAEWVPYRKGQAAKTEALQAQVNATTQGPAQPPEQLRHPRSPRQAEDCHPDPARPSCRAQWRAGKGVLRHKGKLLRNLNYVKSGFGRQNTPFRVRHAYYLSARTIAQKMCQDNFSRTRDTASGDS